MKLVIGNKNYSSWSLRGWLAAKLSGLSFDEELVPLDTAEFAKRIEALSPSLKVPVLHDRDLMIWDSLAIIEYLNDKAPRSGFWPNDPGIRGLARSVAAEMHSGFPTMREHLPMNIRKRFPNYPIEPLVKRDIYRIQDVWLECRRRASAPGNARRAGDFLFGAFSAADIMYAPVVFRFASYDVPLRTEATDYVEAMLAHPFMTEWADAARAESWVIDDDEVRD